MVPWLMKLALSKRITPIVLVKLALIVPAFTMLPPSAALVWDGRSVNSTPSPAPAALTVRLGPSVRTLSSVLMMLLVDPAPTLMTALSNVWLPRTSISFFLLDPAECSPD
jgi:hypothetical protein